MAGRQLREERSCFKSSVSAANIQMAVQLVPGVSIELPAEVAANVSGHRTMNYRPTRCVVHSICRGGRPKVQVLSRDRPSAMRHDRSSSTYRTNVLPPEQIRNAKPIVRRGIHGVEGTMNAVAGIGIS